MATLVQCVSIPRSGHHYLIKLLRAYFNDRSTDTRRMTYCEYYHCCKTRPCRIFGTGSTSPADVHLQKSHDEFLRYADEEIEPPLPISNLAKHLIQFRYPIPSTISEFRLTQARRRQDCGNDRTGSVTHDLLPDPLDWLPYATTAIEYRNRFLEKWILQNPWVDSDQYCFLNYDHLLAQPYETLCEVIRFARPDEIVNPSRVEAALAKRPVKPKRNPQDFEFASTLSELEPLWAAVWNASKAKLKMNC